MMVPTTEDAERFCEGLNLNMKKATNKRPIVVTGNKELRALLKKIFMH